MTCEDTLNRLFAKAVLPRIREAEVKVYLEDWPLERLWATIPNHDETGKLPHQEGDPPIVVRWKGRDYRIDGRRRINQLKRRNEDGPHPVLIVDIGDI